MISAFVGCVRTLFGCGVLLLPGFLGTLVQAHPIAIELSTASGEHDSIQITGSDFASLLHAAVAREDELVRFAGSEFSAHVSYLGAQTVINLQVEADGTSAAIDIPGIGFARTFTAETPQELQVQIENFVRTDGSEPLAELRRIVNRTSSFGITDGNPNATTALFAEVLYDAFGLNRSHGSVRPADHGWAISHATRFGNWQAEDAAGTLWLGHLKLERRLSPRTGIGAVFPGTYMTTDGARTLGAGAAVGVSHDWIPADEAWSAQTALFGGAMLRGSEQLAAGGALWSYGASTGIDYRVARHLSIGWQGQINGFAGIPLDYDGFVLDGVVDQTLTKFGLPVRVRLPRHLAVELNWTRTHFLRAAGVPRYDSTVLAVQWRVRPQAEARLGFEDRRGTGFESGLWDVRWGWAF